MVSNPWKMKRNSTPPLRPPLLLPDFVSPHRPDLSTKLKSTTADSSLCILLCFLPSARPPMSPSGSCFANARSRPTSCVFFHGEAASVLDERGTSTSQLAASDRQPTSPSSSAARPRDSCGGLPVCGVVVPAGVVFNLAGCSTLLST